MTALPNHIRRLIYLATILAVLIIAAAAWLWISRRPTPPTDLSLDPKNLAPLSLPLLDKPVVQSTSTADAGPLYRSALADYANDADAADAYSRDPHGKVPASVTALLDAAACDHATLFISEPEKLANYDSQHPDLETLTEMGNLLDRVGLSLKLKNQIPDAQKYFRASYALGENLFRERICYDEYLKGIGLMNTAAAALAECAPTGSAEQSALTAQSAAITQYDTDHVAPIYQAITSVDQADIAVHAGDIFRFADLSQDRMIRVEAILSVGRLRFDADRSGDQYAAPRELAKLQGDADPVIRAAADAAANLTLEQYRAFH